MREDEHDDALANRRGHLAQQLVLVLPGFGRWASQIRDFETPYGRAGLRQLEALYMLRHELLDPALPPATGLADYFQIQRSVVTRVLAKLEHSGYIARQADPRDGRAQQITVSERGRLLSDYVEQEYFKEMERAIGGIGEQDLACLERSIDLLTGVSRRLGKAEPPGRSRWSQDD
jgi:DNA-binding MarR family transcriptional regulator